MSNQTCSGFHYQRIFVFSFTHHVRKNRAYLGKALNEVFHALPVNTREKCKQGGGWLGEVCNNMNGFPPGAGGKDGHAFKISYGRSPG